jgi:hypothetical protein
VCEKIKIIVFCDNFKIVQIMYAWTKNKKKILWWFSWENSSTFSWEDSNNRTYLDRNFGLSELAGHNDNGGILSKAFL